MRIGQILMLGILTANKRSTGGVPCLLDGGTLTGDDSRAAEVAGNGGDFTANPPHAGTTPPFFPDNGGVCANNQQQTSLLYRSLVAPTCPHPSPSPSNSADFSAKTADAESPPKSGQNQPAQSRDQSDATRRPPLAADSSTKQQVDKNAKDIDIPKEVENSHTGSDEPISTPKEPYIVHAVPKTVSKPTPAPKEEEIVTSPPPPLIPPQGEGSSSEQVQEQQEIVQTTEQQQDVHEQKIGADLEGNSVQEEMLEDKKKDDIISFSEWAVKQTDSVLPTVQETEKRDDKTQTKPRKQNTNKSPSSSKLTKNFASPDCTAKIIATNSESQGGGNVISSSRDEYILNKCSDRAFFVVELCESIKVVKVQMANFELYSSSPKDFRVSIGHTYPGREKDWLPYGTFLYEDERSLQTFKSSGNTAVVGKYAKVEILSHHGTEHYCPVSMFKVFGIPEIDLISGEVDDEGDDDDETTALDHQDNNKPATISSSGQENPIVKSVKTLVNVLKNVVYKPQQNTSIMALDLEKDSLSGASMRHAFITGEVEISEERSRMLTYILATEYTTVKKYLTSMPLESVLMQYCVHIGFPFSSDQNQSSFENDESDLDKSKTVEDSPTKSIEKSAWRWKGFLKVLHGDDFMLLLCNVVSIERGASQLAFAPLHHNVTTDFVIVNSTTSKNATVIKTNGQVVANGHLGSGSNDEGHVNLEDKNGKAGDNKTHHINNDLDKEAKNLEAKKMDGSSGNQPNIDITKDPNLLKQVSGAENGAPGNGVGGGGQGPGASRETTWQKLANRIRALERNVSLSTGFLQELSLKYIKQIDELNTAVKQMNENIAVLGKKEESCRQRGIQLEKKVENLSLKLEKFETNLADTQEELMSRHGLLVVLEVCFLGLLLFWCTPTNSHHSNLSSRQKQPAQLTRRLSLDTLKSEKLAKENKTTSGGRNIDVDTARRKSIEVGGLCTVGSMVDPLDATTSNSKKKNRKKKKRKDGLGSNSNSVPREAMTSTSARLKNVQEESDEEVYMTFHGRSQELYVPPRGQRKRSNSWSENLGNQSRDSNENVNSQSHFYAGMDEGEEKMREIHCDKIHQNVDAKKMRQSQYATTINSSSGSTTNQLIPSSQNRFSQPPRTGNQDDFYGGPYWEKHVKDVLNSTRFLVRKVTSEQQQHHDRSSWGVVHNNNNSHRNKRIKDHANKRTSVPNIPLHMPNVQVSNMYSLLDSSVHDVYVDVGENYDDDETTTTTDTDMPPLHLADDIEDTAVLDPDAELTEGSSVASSMISTPNRKIQRSKSTSPSRHTMNMMKKQKVLFKKFKPENADWLQ